MRIVLLGLCHAHHDIGVIVYGLALAGVALAGAVLPAKAMDVSHTLGATVFGGISGLLFLLAGAVAHHRRPANRTGLLMVLVGLGWFAEDVRFLPTSVTFTLGLCLTTASGGFIAHMVLAFPDGRLGTVVRRGLAAAAYTVAFGLTVVGALFVDPTEYGQVFPRNLMLIDSPAMLALMGRLVTGAGAIIAVGVVVVLAHGWVVATAPRRRVLAPVYLTGLAGGVASGLGNSFGGSGLLMVYQIAFCLLPLAFLAGVLRVELGRTGVSALLLDLGRPLSTSDLQVRLGAALGDPSLRVGHWRADTAELIGADGIPMPPPGRGRAVTFIDHDGRRVAGFEHDAALAEDGHVLRAVATAAGLTLSNQRLTEQVRESDARLVAAVTQERRRIERDLHDRVQQNLVAASIGVRAAAQQLGPEAGSDVRRLLHACGEGLDSALADLRALARGIHPAILTEAGLVPALRALAQRSPVAVEMAAGDVPRLPATVEATAYHVVAEALTNAMKHAAAQRIRVEVGHRGGSLHVSVVDDGVGGADLNRGTGLAGLAERVRALGGELTVRCTPGTAVSAVLPAATSSSPAPPEPAAAALAVPARTAVLPGAAI